MMEQVGHGWKNTVQMSHSELGEREEKREREEREIREIKKRKKKKEKRKKCMNSCKYAFMHF